MPLFWKFAASFICIGILIWAPNPALAQSPPPTENSTPDTPKFASLFDYNQAKKARDITAMWSLGAGLQQAGIRGDRVASGDGQAGIISQMNLA